MLPQIINKQIRHAVFSTQLNLNTNSARQSTFHGGDVQNAFLDFKQIFLLCTAIMFTFY